MNARKPPHGLAALLLFVVLLLAGLWIALFLVRLAGWWPWFENAPDGPWAAVTLPALAVLVIAVAFIHDRILRRAGVRPAEPAAVTARKALREAAGSAGELLLFAALAVPWVLFWGFLFIVSGLRARMYGAGEIWVWVLTIAGMALIGGSVWLSHRWIMRRRRK